MAEQLKARIWVVDDPTNPIDPLTGLSDTPLQNGANKLHEDNVKAAETCKNEGKHITYPLMVSFRPPETQPFGNKLLEWNKNNEIYLKVLFFDATPNNEVMYVDFGAYFDFPLPDGSNMDYPNYPEDTEDVVMDTVTVNPSSQYAYYYTVGFNEKLWDKRNLRYRSFKSKEVHYLYNMRISSRESLQNETPVGSLNFLLDNWARWDRNQFIFWASHTSVAERSYLDPIRRIMLQKTLQVGDEVRERLKEDEGGGLMETPPCAEYLVWLHQAILKSMDVQRKRITARAKIGFKNKKQRRAEKIVEDITEDINDDASWKRGKEGIEALKIALVERVEASLWAFDNVMKSEWKDALNSLTSTTYYHDELDEEPEELEGGDNDDFEENKIFPFPSHDMSYNWSNVKWAGRLLEFRKETQFMKLLKQQAAPEDVAETLIPIMTSLGDLKEEFFNNWEALDDTLARILQSGLMVGGGQIAGLQTFIGSRVHFRLALLLSDGLTVHDDEEPLELLDPRVYFPWKNLKVR